MTTRYHSLIAVLENNIRDDDAMAIISAIKMIKGVISVSGEEADPESYMAEKRALKKLRDQMADILYP